MSNVYRNTSLTLPEVFKRVAAMKDATNEEKAKELSYYDSVTLQWFVDVMYNAPVGGIDIPQYVESQLPIGNHYSTLHTVRSKLESIIADKNSLASTRSLRLILENVHANEAVLIADLLKGNKVNGISKGVFKKLYPEFFQESGNQTLEELMEED